MRGQFYTNLTIATAISAICVLLFYYYGNVADHIDFLALSLIVMTLISTLVFIFGMRTIGSENKFSFTRFSLIHTFLKLFILIAMVVVYRLYNDIDSISFIWPFLLMYVIYTWLETQFLLKIARL